MHAYIHTYITTTHLHTTNKRTNEITKESTNQQTNQLIKKPTNQSIYPNRSNRFLFEKLIFVQLEDKLFVIYTNKFYWIVYKSSSLLHILTQNNPVTLCFNIIIPRMPPYPRSFLQFEQFYYSCVSLTHVHTTVPHYTSVHGSCHCLSLSSDQIFRSTSCSQTSQISVLPLMWDTTPYRHTKQKVPITVLHIFSINAYK